MVSVAATAGRSASMAIACAGARRGTQAIALPVEGGPLIDPAPAAVVVVVMAMVMVTVTALRCAAKAGEKRAYRRRCDDGTDNADRPSRRTRASAPLESGRHVGGALGGSGSTGRAIERPTPHAARPLADRGPRARMEPAVATARTARAAQARPSATLAAAADALSARELRAELVPRRRRVTVDSVQSVEDLPRKTWHMYRVSRLHGFRYDATSFERHGRALASFLDAERNSGFGAAVAGLDASDEETDALHADDAVGAMPMARAALALAAARRKGTTVRAELSTVPHVASTPYDADAVCIRAALHDAEDMRPLLIAMLVCVGRTADQGGAAADPSTTWLPVMLLRGSALVRSRFAVWLQSTFDCRCAPLQLPPTELAWLAYVWAVPVDVNVRNTYLPSAMLELTFRAPPAVSPQLSSIVLSVDAVSAAALREDIMRLLRMWPGAAARGCATARSRR